MKYKNIFSVRVAKHLLSLGERVHSIKPNKTKPGYTVYVFEKGPDFDEHMKIATERRHEKTEES